MGDFFVFVLLLKTAVLDFGEQQTVETKRCLVSAPVKSRLKSCTADLHFC